MHNARSLLLVAVCLLATAICAEASISANYTVAIPLNITGGGDMSVQAFSKSPFAFVLAANGANSSLTAFNYKSASLISSIPINCSGGGRLVGVERTSLLVVFCNAELHVAYFANGILSPLATIPNTPYQYTRYTVSDDSTKIYFLVGTDSSCAVTVTALDLTEFTVNPISVYNASADYYYVTGCAMGTVSPNGQFLSIEQYFVTDDDGGGMEVASYNISTWDRNEYPFVFFDNPNEDPSYYNFSPDLLIPAPLNASQYLGFIRRDVVPIGYNPYQVYLSPVLLPSGLGWPGVSTSIISKIQQSSMLTTSHEDGCYYLSGYTDVDTGGFDTTTEQYALLPTPHLVGTVALPCVGEFCGITATASHLFNVDGGNLYVYDVVCK